MDWNTLREQLESLVYPAADGEDERRWADQFRMDCIEMRPTKLTNHLVMMGAGTSVDCDGYHEPFEIDKDAKRHDDLHLVYNTIIWRSLRDSKKMAAVRTVIKRDLLVPDTIPDSGAAFGRIVRKDYGRKLLAHFLLANPSPDWVLPQ